MPLVCECFLLGCFLTCFTRYKKTGKCFYLLGVTLFLAFGYGFGRTYLYNLERRYPPFEPTTEQCESLRGTPIVVLGQGMPEKSDLPVRYQNNPVFERRLFEGIRVAKLIPDSYLVVSMAGDGSNSVKQAALDDYMRRLNFPTNRVAMFTTARDTSEEAKLAKNCLIALLRDCVIGSSNTMSNTYALAKSESTNQSVSLSVSLERSVITNKAIIILTTSASHIPRAMKIFQKLGLNPIPSPCDYTNFEAPQIKWENGYQWPLPSGGNIDHSERALYEWLGNIYERTF